MNQECPCGIARVDCEYHRPEKKEFHLADQCRAEWHIPADIPKVDRLQVVINGRAVGYVDELPLGWTLPED